MAAQEQIVAKNGKNAREHFRRRAVVLDQFATRLQQNCRSFAARKNAKLWHTNIIITKNTASTVIMSTMSMATTMTTATSIITTIMRKKKVTAG